METRTWIRPSGGWAYPGDLQTSFGISGSTTAQNYVARIQRFSLNAQQSYVLASDRSTNSFYVASAGVAGELTSTSLSRYSVEGGHNGTEPVLTVRLDGPAQVGGQTVYVRVDNNKARIFNWGVEGRFTIPEGQTQGAWSWWLDTDPVLFTRMC